MCMISIIVPVYNMAQYIDSCIKSILDQTYSDFELILIDDGSTDESGFICDNYERKFSQINVIHKENGGLSSARNCGIDVAKGKYLMFVDADDRIHPQTCYFFEKLAEEKHADIVMGKAIERNTFVDDMFPYINNCTYKIWTEKQNRLKEIYFEDKHKYWTAWCKLYRKEMFKDNRFEEGKLYEDNGLIFKLLYDANIVVDIDEIFYFYLINNKGITKKEFSKKNLDILWAYELQITFFKEHNDYYMMRIIVCRYLLTCAEFYLKKRDCREEMKERLRVGMNKWEKKFELKIQEIPNVYKILFPLKYYPYAAIKKIVEKIK